MPDKTIQMIAVILCAVLFLEGCPVMAEPLLTGPEKIDHVYVQNGIENVIIAADKLHFQKEVDQFRSGRLEYGLFWTGIVAGIIIYFNSRAK